jgi:hypothetical protein
MTSRGTAATVKKAAVFPGRQFAPEAIARFPHWSLCPNWLTCYTDLTRLRAGELDGRL